MPRKVSEENGSSHLVCFQSGNDETNGDLKAVLENPVDEERNLLKIVLSNMKSYVRNSSLLCGHNQPKNIFHFFCFSSTIRVF